MPGPIVSRVTRRLTGIYLRQGETFIAMRGTPSEAEDVLPQLVAENPEMLAGEHEENGGHRWLLIERGSPVSETEGAAGRWSADHLFIDQDRVPTVVEAKRSINPDPVERSSRRCSTTPPGSFHGHIPQGIHGVIVLLDHGEGVVLGIPPRLARVSSCPADCPWV